MAENRITKFEGVYSDDLDRELYLLNKVEITEDQFTAVKETLGITGPGRQVIAEGEKFFLLSDELSDDAKVRIDEELVDKGEEPVFEEDDEDTE